MVFDMTICSKKCIYKVVKKDMDVYRFQSFGRAHKKKRILRGWSQEYLAERSGYSQKHIGNIELGYTIPSLKAIIRISNELDSSLDELLCDTIYKSKAYICDDISAQLDTATESQIKAISKLIATLLEEWNRNDLT